MPESQLEILEWIYCKDRMPKKDGDYIVSIIAKNGKEYTVTSAFWDRLFRDGFDVIDRRVYAWAELPSPARPIPVGE